MIGLVLVTHGQLAEHFVAAVEHVVGPQPALETICIAADDDLDIRRDQIAKAVAKVDCGAGVILLTDMFGATPSNLALSTRFDTQVEVIAGVNLPILVRLAMIRGRHPLREAVFEAREAGRNFINVASTLIEDDGRPR